MGDLWEYITKNTVRGDCTCGKCIDKKEDPQQPSGHTVDLIFFKVAKKDSANKEIFFELVKKEFPHWLDGKEHSYLEIGADIGDQGIALMTMGLGNLLGVWDLLSPETMTPFLPRELKLQMAGQGLITIKYGG